MNPILQGSDCKVMALLLGIFYPLFFATSLFLHTSDVINETYLGHAVKFAVGIGLIIDVKPDYILAVGDIFFRQLLRVFDSLQHTQRFYFSVQIL